MNLLFKFVKQYKKVLVGALVLATINQVFSLLDPQILRLLVDRYANQAHTLTSTLFLHGVVLLLLASMGVSLVSRVAKNFQDYFVNVITQRVGAGLYSTSVAHSFALPYYVFEDQRSGELLQKLQKARSDSERLISSFINGIFLSAIGILFVLIYAFSVNWLIGFVFSLIIPTLGFATFVIGRRIRLEQKKIVAETATLAGSTTETLRNVELVKSLGLEDQEVHRLNQANDRILNLELKKIRLIRSFSFIQGTLVNTVRSLVMLVMLWLIFQQSITLGQFFSLLFYSFFIFGPLSDLSSVSAQYQETKASMEQLEGILTIKPEEKPKSPIVAGAITEVAFKDVSFTYGSSEDASIRDARLQIKNGESIAFVGPSGAGKTTLVKLLVGLYKPTGGQILINGIDSQTLDLDNIRRRIGYVSQDTQLFAGTIRENLLFVNPHATDAECLSALSDASALNVIERGGKGLDTVIGEGGIKISGGERQRLAIARALLRNPEIIIFDEATSSLDSITERSITDTIRKISEVRHGLITIMIAHRLSTIAHADKIYVLEKGSIIEEGSHGELLKSSSLYAALWREQGAF